MKYTQVELSGKDFNEVWWIPSPGKDLKTGEEITIIMEEPKGWKKAQISQICVTMNEELVPKPSRIAYDYFKRRQGEYE